MNQHELKEKIYKSVWVSVCYSFDPVRIDVWNTIRYSVSVSVEDTARHSICSTPGSVWALANDLVRNSMNQKLKSIT